MVDPSNKAWIVLPWPIRLLHMSPHPRYPVYYSYNVTYVHYLTCWTWFGKASCWEAGWPNCPAWPAHQTQKLQHWTESDCQELQTWHCMGCGQNWETVRPAFLPCSNPKQPCVEAGLGFEHPNQRFTDKEFERYTGKLHGHCPHAHVRICSKWTATQWHHNYNV